MKRALFLLALISTVACSSSTGPDSKQTWADNTSWQGTVAMKSGTTLSISFQLSTALVRPLMSQYEHWGIFVNHARIQNVVTGVTAAELPDTSPSGLNVDSGADEYTNTVWVSLHPNAAFDPTVPSCPKNGERDNFPVYEISVQPTNGTTLTGIARLFCFDPSNVTLDSQPIVLRRI